MSREREREREKRYVKRENENSSCHEFLTKKFEEKEEKSRSLVSVKKEECNFHTFAKSHDPSPLPPTPSPSP
jgi:hypothetical protein